MMCMCVLKQKCRPDLIEIANKIDPDEDIGVQSDSGSDESSSESSSDNSYDSSDSESYSSSETEKEVDDKEEGNEDETVKGFSHYF